MEQQGRADTEAKRTRGGPYIHTHEYAHPVLGMAHGYSVTTKSRNFWYEAKWMEALDLGEHYALVRVLPSTHCSDVRAFVGNQCPWLFDGYGNLKLTLRNSPEVSWPQIVWEFDIINPNVMVKYRKVFSLRCMSLEDWGVINNYELLFLK